MNRKEYIKQYLIDYFKYVFREIKGKKETREINDVTELSSEDVDKLPPSIKRIKIAKNQGLYSVEEYKLILEKISDITKDIEMPIKDDIESELKAYTTICRELANRIEYDDYAITEEGKKDKNLVERCRNLSGGLLDGKCVCRGYAIILKNVLATVGIESKVISGKSEGLSRHAWNQVKIGGQWFNVDLTNDRDYIVDGKIDLERDILYADSEFENPYKVDEFSRDKPEKCKLPITYSLYKKRNNLEERDEFKEKVDPVIVNQMLRDEELKLTSKQKAKLICCLESDSDKANILRQENIEIDDRDKESVIRSFQSVEAKKELLFDKEFNMWEFDRDLSIIDINDINLLEEYMIKVKPTVIPHFATIEQAFSNLDKAFAFKKDFGNGKYDELAQAWKERKDSVLKRAIEYKETSQIVEKINKSKSENLLGSFVHYSAEKSDITISKIRETHREIIGRIKEFKTRGVIKDYAAKGEEKNESRD